MILFDMSSRFNASAIPSVYHHKEHRDKRRLVQKLHSLRENSSPYMTDDLVHR